MACPILKRFVMAVPLLCLALLLLVPAQAWPADDAKDAQTAAQAWLKLVDSGDYKASWQESGAFFQGAMAAEKWSELIKGVRPPLGKVLSRKFVSATPRQTMPGAPDGKYYMLLFKTSFSNKKAAEERVTLIHEPGRGWRVVGYLIK
jgi:hypothetical protein